MQFSGVITQHANNKRDKPKHWQREKMKNAKGKRSSLSKLENVKKRKMRRTAVRTLNVCPHRIYAYNNDYDEDGDDDDVYRLLCVLYLYT